MTLTVPHGSSVFEEGVRGGCSRSVFEERVPGKD